MRRAVCLIERSSRGGKDQEKDRWEHHCSRLATTSLSRATGCALASPRHSCRLQNDGAVAGFGNCSVVRDHEYRHLRRQFAEQSHHGLAKVGVEVGCRLVCYDEVHVACQHSGDGNPLTLTPRETRDALVGKAPHVDLGKRSFYTCSMLIRRNSGVGQVLLEHLARSTVRKEPEILRDEADAAQMTLAVSVSSKISPLRSENFDGSLVSRLQSACQQLDEGTLAGATRTGDGDQASAAHV
jgi:hypothetical protein